MPVSMGTFDAVFAIIEDVEGSQLGMCTTGSGGS